jgi:hypothetical protein
MLDVLGENQSSFDYQATKTVCDEYDGSLLCLAKLNNNCQQIFKRRGGQRSSLGRPPVANGRGIPICLHEAVRPGILHGYALCLLMPRPRTQPHLHCIHTSIPSRRPRLRQREEDQRARRRMAFCVWSRSCKDAHQDHERKRCWQDISRVPSRSPLGECLLNDGIFALVHFRDSVLLDLGLHGPHACEGSEGGVSL